MALVDPFKPTLKCSKCGTSAPWTISYDQLCKGCFQERQEKKSVEERLLELEIGMFHASQHQHVENMRF